MPERDQLKAIRTFLLDHYQQLERVMDDRKLHRLFTPDYGERLSRPPKGFPKEHPAMALLKCRQWAVGAKLPATAALDPALVKTVSAHFRAAAPLVSLLNEPLTRALKAQRQTIFGLY